MLDLYKYKKIMFFFIIGLMLSACGPPTPTPDPDELVVVDEVSVDLTLDWYVATDGDNDNSCTTPAEPCLTLGGAYRKSRPFDRIHLDTGTYVESGTSGSLLHLWSTQNVTVIGESAADTILDAGSAVGGVFLAGTAKVRLENLTIQNTRRGSASGCVETRDDSEAILVNVILNNCFRSGITHNSTGVDRLTNVIIRNTIDENIDPDFVLNGSGIDNGGEMILEGGEIYGNGNSGISNSGLLLATGTVIRDNQSHGIDHTGTLLILDDVTISGNGIFAPQRAGILARGSGTIRITDSRIIANLNTGIVLGSGQELDLDSTIIRDHSSMGLNLRAGSHSIITNSTIQNNGLRLNPRADPSNPSAIYNEGTLLLTLSKVLDNRYGGLVNAASGRVYISKSELSGNLGDEPAVNNHGDTSYLQITQSLIANNQTGDRAAVVNNNGIARILTTTISNNSGTGLALGWDNTTSFISYSTIVENGGNGIWPGRFPVDNTIIANNTAGQCIASIPIGGGTVTGTNIDTDGSCGFPAASTYTSAALLLGPLADNGGPSRTHALLDGSPAIDAAVGRCLPEDQRGELRPGGTSCDSGAYEDPIGLPPSVASETPELTATKNANCRYGPGTAYDIADTLFEGQTALVLARNQGNTWFQIAGPSFGTDCWVSYVTVKTSGAVDAAPIGTGPALPDAPPASPQGCFVYDQNQASVCTVPCPSNPQPGGVCTP